MDDDLKNHPSLRALRDATPVGGDDRFDFSCRGCGQNCCVNMQIFISPPEAMRILWHLERHPEMATRLQRQGVRWGDLSIGYSTGFPTLQMLMRRSAALPEVESCPFLAPVHRPDGDRSVPTGMHWCSLHTARPVACRTYPLAVLGSADEELEYTIVSRCPGFEPAQDGEVVPPDYAPAPRTQTVASWRLGQSNAEQLKEVQHYTRVVLPAFNAAHCHAATEDNPGGVLSDDQTIQLGARFFYRPIPAPAAPADDHATLLRWMDELIAYLPTIERQLREI
ncbi:MAG: YkgJ family cysteine cluster protein [Candidatus Eisenbacteria bacterium]